MTLLEYRKKIKALLEKLKLDLPLHARVAIVAELEELIDAVFAAE